MAQTLQERLATMTTEELRTALRWTAGGDRTHAASRLAHIDNNYAEDGEKLANELMHRLEIESEERNTELDEATFANAWVEEEGRQLEIAAELEDVALDEATWNSYWTWVEYEEWYESLPWWKQLLVQLKLYRK